MALKKSKSVVAIAAVSSLLLLVACGDDDSDFATRPSDDLSSSVSSSSRHSGLDPESSSKGDGGSDAAMTMIGVNRLFHLGFIVDVQGLRFPLAGNLSTTSAPQTEQDNLRAHL